MRLSLYESHRQDAGVLRVAFEFRPCTSMDQGIENLGSRLMATQSCGFHPRLDFRFSSRARV